METTLAQYIGVTPAKVGRLLKMSQSQIYADKEYMSWVEWLDVEQLYNTLVQAREIHARYQEDYNRHLYEHHGYVNTVMSPYTLGNWLLGFLQFPNTLSSLPRAHDRLPQAAIAELMPHMIDVLSEMPEGAKEWQQALAIIALPLLAHQG